MWVFLKKTNMIHSICALISLRELQRDQSIQIINACSSYRGHSCVCETSCSQYKRCDSDVFLLRMKAVLFTENAYFIKARDIRRKEIKMIEQSNCCVKTVSSQYHPGLVEQDKGVEETSEEKRKILQQTVKKLNQTDRKLT